MRKKLLAVALSLTMVVGALTGCGGSEGTTTPTENKTTATSDGKVLNVYVWNDEFQQRFESYYPGYDKKTGKIGDVQVKFIKNSNEDNVYQTKLDEALAKQADAAADDKIDIFLCEMDYVNKYTGTTYAMDVKEVGLTDDDMAQMYNYTKQAATDASGVLRAVSWQGCPGGFIYRRSYAKDLFGTDDPADIQEKVSDWDTFTATAKEVKDKSNGKITMLSGFDDALRVYSNNVTMPWVDENNKIQMDPNVDKWIDQTKEYTDAGYNAKTSLWKDDWTAGMGENGNVFGYFMPAWGINFSMADASGSKKDKDGKHLGGGSYGDWAVVTGPQSYNWGGSFICAATGTDNKDLVADIMKKLCCDESIMYNISKETQDFVNNKAANEKLEADEVVSEFLGGQSLVAALSDAAEKIDCSHVSPYDQACTEELMTAMKEYYNGNVEKDAAIEAWKDAVIKKHPGLTK